MNNKHTAIYMRVSTNGQNLDSQEDDLTAWVKAQQAKGELTGEVRWYRDKSTGRTMDRPGWNEFNEALENGQVQHLVIWKFDRLGRTTLETLQFVQRLDKLDVGLTCIRDQFDLSSPLGRAMMRILAAFSEFDNDVRAERVRAGIAAARKRGKRWGGSEAGRLLKVTPEQIDQIAMLRRDRQMSFAKIGKAVGLGKSTVYAVWRNYRYGYRRKYDLFGFRNDK